MPMECMLLLKRGLQCPPRFDGAPPHGASPAATAWISICMPGTASLDTVIWALAGNFRAGNISVRTLEKVAPVADGGRHLG